jgi:hypothetical protein
MTSSRSSDSAIVVDDWDDRQIKYRNSWPKMMEKNPMIFTSFDHLDEDNESISKYRRPLPWMNHLESFDEVFLFLS